MAEERNLSLSRVDDSTDEEVDQTKAALQRRMEEARESISQTVTEIKDTVVNQYQQVKENISDTLDWREQYRRHTLPFTLTAFAVGAFAGYTVMGAFKGDGDEEEYEDEGAFDRVEQGFDRGLKGAPRSYAAQPVLGKSAAAYQRITDEGEDVGPETRPSYSSGYHAPTAPQPHELAAYASAAPATQQEDEQEEPKGPGLIERFKETKAYDRLQEELSSLGDRALEELSKTARNVVVPALLNKLKGLIGLDLSGQQQQSSAPRRPSAGTQTAQPAYAGGGPTGAAESAGSTASTGSTGTSARAAAGGTEGYGAS